MSLKNVILQFFSDTRTASNRARAEAAQQAAETARDQAQSASGLEWGGIGGTLSDQNDLNTELGNKENVSNKIPGSSSWGGSPSDDKYLSEKFAKQEFDKKTDKSKGLIYVDSISSLMNIDTSIYENIVLSGFYAKGDLTHLVRFTWNAGALQSDHNGWSSINPEHAASIGSDDWYSSTGNGTDDSGNGVWELSSVKGLTILNFGAKDEAGYDSTTAIQTMADELGVVNIPHSTNPFEIDEITTTRKTIFNAVDGVANIKLRTPTVTNAPGITLAHDGSKVNVGFHFDGNSTSRTCVYTTANDCVTIFTAENVTADADSTTYTSGLVVEGDNHIFDVYAENFSNTGQANGSVPRVVTIQSTANNYQGKARGDTITSGIITGSSTGHGKVQSVDVINADDNGIYQLGGELDVDSFIYDGSEEGAIVGGTLNIGRYVCKGGGIRPISLNDGEYLRIGLLEIRQDGTESLGNIMATRSGAGFGTVQIDQINGRLRGNTLFNLGNALAVDNLVLGGVDIDYEYDAGVTGLVSQWCNFEDVERFSITNFNARIIDINDVLTGSDEFEFRLPTVTKESQLYHPQIEILDSDESTVSDATVTYSGTTQDLVYFIASKQQQGSWDPVYEGSVSGSVSGASQRWERDGAHYTIYLDDVVDLSSLSGDITVSGLPEDAVVRGVSPLTHNSDVSYPSGTTMLIARAAGSVIEFLGYGSGANGALTGGDVSGSARYVATIKYRA